MTILTQNSSLFFNIMVNNNMELILKSSTKSRCDLCDSEFVDESNLVKQMDAKHEALEVQQYALCQQTVSNVTNARNY